MGDETRPLVGTWVVPKEELKDQFLPCNSSWVARELLRRLKQTGTAREHVKQFSSLTLDIRDMSEEDKPFLRLDFMTGLQNWAQLELHRVGVKDLTFAIASADGLLDYELDNSNGKKSE